MDLIALGIILLIGAWIVGGILMVLGKGVEVGSRFYRDQTRDRSLDPYKARIVRDASQWDDSYYDD